VHLIGAVPNGLTVEYMPWLGMMFKEVPVQQGGELTMPAKPGLGLEFDEATLEKYKA
jgi:L-alanine-DL-glutamate epimerase-like enolase superfamily enzyme